MSVEGQTQEVWGSQICEDVDSKAEKMHYITCGQRMEQIGNQLEEDDVIHHLPVYTSV
ncbi:hypothetical protein L798_06813 [Zootermopsis nevadensis]|uniref:Uncharacterized protein n=1 Tax=Zootermopsis nevadensis TaxID=136037 RepID=A0A067R764_ZOONE|nr:hypothetical protein L798_06813 [Zootermopsis nevadensis]